MPHKYPQTRKYWIVVTGRATNQPIISKDHALGT